MKTTFALAFVMFMLYLAGCDVVNVEPGPPADLEVAREQIEQLPAPHAGDAPAPYYAPMADTTRKP